MKALKIDKDGNVDSDVIKNHKLLKSYFGEISSVLSIYHFKHEFNLDVKTEKKYSLKGKLFCDPIAAYRYDPCARTWSEHAEYAELLWLKVTEYPHECEARLKQEGG